MWITAIEVPPHLLTAVSMLHHSIWTKINRYQTEEILSIIRVIQGTLSYSIWSFHKWSQRVEECDNEDTKLEKIVIKSFLYADDIIFLARDDISSQKHLDTLARFCIQN